MRVLFIDPCCPKPYDPQVLATESLGGTEATVIRVAEGLASKDHVVVVKQHNRTDEYQGAGNVYYRAFGEPLAETPTHVIVLRAPQALYQRVNSFHALNSTYGATTSSAAQGGSKAFRP